jgi:hypothetical protein
VHHALGLTGGARAEDELGELAAGGPPCVELGRRVAVINQAPMWTRRMTRRELDRAISTLIDTLMKLVGTPPPIVE